MITINGTTYAEISPVKANFSDENDSTLLKVYIASDNLIDSCLLRWMLFVATTTTIDGVDVTTVTQTATGSLSITGTDYSGWDGSNTFPYTFVADELELTLV
jgi:hypothetical protein